jgi:RNA polymerase-binding transcription factor DksA
VVVTSTGAAHDVDPEDETMQKLDVGDARERLTKRQAELEDLRRSFLHDDGSPMADTRVEPSAGDRHPADVATDTFERSKEVSILSTVERSLADVSFALDQLAQGSYGRCQACGASIGTARLEARPEARYCIDDQALAERSA